MPITWLNANFCTGRSAIFVSDARNVTIRWTSFASLVLIGLRVIRAKSNAKHLVFDLGPRTHYASSCIRSEINQVENPINSRRNPTSIHRESRVLCGPWMPKFSLNRLATIDRVIRCYLRAKIGLRGRRSIIGIRISLNLPKYISDCTHNP